MTRLASYLILLLAMLYSHSASATTLTASTISSCFGSATCIVGSATISATPAPGATITEQNLLGLRGIGVAFAIVGDPLRQPEIQGDIFNGQTEGLRITFSTPQTLSQVGIGHLANPDLFSTDAQEIASVTAIGTLGTATLTLQSLSNTGGLGTGFIVNDTSLFTQVSRLSTNTGEFLIANPFSNLGYINSLQFFAPNTPTATVDNSDFSVTLVQTAAVPLPSSGLSLAIAVLALGRFLRRRTRTIIRT